ncbi:hypothetical protein [Metapseudomonas resinovorans]|uniref:DUF3077 domain-containing protein n=1 Tax=Metapseudomonas resinovorans NBRC 106553 TaxID=1245471 RepID=S6AGD9_METRE|nr:hypothetical protein [Pseudomonas resinovorans]BAN47040.1 hypothetical protein PCA10_13080 [Pseudomonas resinovorans NBRC 106553]
MRRHDLTAPPGFRPLPLPSQPYDDVLFINAEAPSSHLFEAASQRMAALGDLLQILENGAHGDVLPQETARLASALGLLLADAQALHEAAFRRVREEEGGTPAETNG